MIKHLLKIIWNRKRVNGLILTEIVLSFLVLFGVIVMATLYTVNYRRPLGFSVERVWSVGVDPHVSRGFEQEGEPRSDGPDREHAARPAADRGGGGHLDVAVLHVDFDLRERSSKEGTSTRMSTT